MIASNCSKKLVIMTVVLHFYFAGVILWTSLLTVATCQQEESEFEKKKKTDFSVL